MTGQTEREEPHKRQGDEMDLPGGKKCGDCVYLERCETLIQQRSFDERCDWSPSRFREKKGPPVPTIPQLPSGFQVMVHGTIKELFIADDIFSQDDKQKRTVVSMWAAGGFGDKFKPVTEPIWLALTFLQSPPDGQVVPTPPKFRLDKMVKVMVEALKGYAYEDAGQVLVVIAHKAWAMPGDKQGVKVVFGRMQ